MSGKMKLLASYTRQDFYWLTGRNAIDDDLDRVNCPDAGKPGHSCCGVCPRCRMPRFSCTCDTHSHYQLPIIIDDVCEEYV